MGQTQEAIHSRNRPPHPTGHGLAVVAAYRITVERISTGERGPGGVVRCETELEARAHAEEVIRRSPTPDDFRVVEVTRDPEGQER
jgi:hypothetical protein